jgi:hypothetical protein
MIRLEIISHAQSNYGSNTYRIVPASTWTLINFLNEIKGYYEPYGGCNAGSNVYIFKDATAFENYYMHFDGSPLVKFTIPHKQSMIDLSDMNSAWRPLQVRCDKVVGFWGCDNWYLYLADDTPIPERPLFL